MAGFSRPSHKRKARAACLAFFFFAGCKAASPPPAAGPSEWFSERAHESGLDFVHFNGMSGEFYYPEIMPPGCCAVRLRQRRRPRRLRRPGPDARDQAADRRKATASAGTI